MQINRMFEIVYLLINRKQVTAQELADHFEVSKRTILRDIDRLTEANIPIYTLQGKGGGIAIMDNYIFNKSLLSEQEQEQILLALKSLSATQNAETLATFSKLQSLFDKPDSDWIEVDFSHWGSPAAEQQKFALIKQAILARQVVEFDYLNSYGQKLHRTAEPLKIVYKSHSWYLQAFCQTKQAHRVFKLSRIRNLSLCSQHFTATLPPSLALDTNSCDKRNTISLKLLFSPQVAYRVYDEHDESAITTMPDGNLLVTVTYPYDEWVIGHILSFSTFVTVLEPPFLQDEIVNRATKIVENYSKDINKSSN